jgi:hypothetical protein
MSRISLKIHVGFETGFRSGSETKRIVGSGSEKKSFQIHNTAPYRGRDGKSHLLLINGRESSFHC